MQIRIQFLGGPLDGQEILFPLGIAEPSTLLYANGDFLDFDHPSGIYELRSKEDEYAAYYWKPA